MTTNIKSDREPYSKQQSKPHKKIYRIICTLLAVMMLAGTMVIAAGALAGCCKNDKKQPELTGAGVIHEPEFGGVYITMTIDDFNALGFQYGDSVDVKFSNGYELKDLPYYNGYYTQTGKPLLIAYPGYDYIKAAINNGADLWEVAGISENDTATVTLAKRGKYADIQSARDLHYEDIREKFPSDEVFANFRAIKAGNLKENTVYRSASPCDNQHNRATYVDRLINAAGVKYIVNLSDNDDKIHGYIDADGFDSPYFLSLYQAGSVIPLALNMNFGSEEFRGKVVRGLTAMADNDGPYLIHCTEGKDRTGFVCMLIEALTGATYEEIVADYMITYYNYYGITEQNEKAKYDIIVSDVLDPMIRSMAGDENLDLKTADLAACAEAFLKNAGMDEAKITLLKQKLTGQN